MKKILVVEDNETNMYLWRRILKNGGYEVIPATSGEEARACNKGKTRPDTYGHPTPRH